MSRLDSFIRRMSAQKILLEHAAELVRDRPGPIVDLGIGAGRTFDHLRVLFPEREVFAFDTLTQSALGVLPDASHMVMGDIRETLNAALPRLKARAALIHNDLGSGDDTFNHAQADWLAPAIATVARADAIVVTSFLIPFHSARILPLPAGVAPGRYHIQELALAV